MAQVTGIADAIDALRAELGEALVRAAGEGVRFRVKPVELTLQAVVIRGADGRIGWGVLGIGAKAESAVTQVLRLELEPMIDRPGHTGSDLIVSDQGDGVPSFG
jgi:hypothetical protein